MRVLLLLALAGVLCAAEEAPSWVRELATAAVPAYGPKVPAVVLLDEGHETVQPDGTQVMTHRYVVKVLTREGRDEALAVAHYVQGASKVRGLDAWMVHPSGKVKRYGKTETMDLAGMGDGLYDEIRQRVIAAKADAEPGSVFACERTVEDRSVVAQSRWSFQGGLPVLRSRYRLTLPPGWRAESHVFQHARMEPAVEGSTTTWELRDLPFREVEPGAPDRSSVSPWLAVSFVPAGGESRLRVLTSWSDVARWMGELNDSQAVPDAAIQAKVAALTAGVVTPWDKIRVLGRYVQKLKYVSIQMDLGRGGGYRPHTAAQVFQKGYGDCKDKANLLRTMLQAAGLKAWPVGVYWGNREHVRPEWASPGQFNHAIVAVEVGPEIREPAVVDAGGAGRLLFFDATDEFTPVGHLPHEQQGSHVLVVKGEGTLVRLPVAPASASVLVREIAAELAADGTLQARVEERSSGRALAQARAMYRARTSAEYRSLMERWVSQGATGAQVTMIEAKDGEADDSFHLQLAFSAPGYAKRVTDRLLTVKPGVLPGRSLPDVGEKQRTLPLLLHGRAFSETMTMTLPAGYAVDELPDAVTLATPFGSYQASVEAKGKALVYRRALELKTATVPPEQYGALREFVGRVHGAEDAPVVLVRE